MKLQKRFVTILLTMVLLATIAAPVATAARGDLQNQSTASTSRRMDSLDLLISAYSVLNATAEGEQSLWNNISDVQSVSPLYSATGEILAYYICFYPNGYVIINNNVSNPIALEFSSEENMLLNNAIEEAYQRSNGIENYFVYYDGSLAYNIISSSEIDANVECATSRTLSVDNETNAYFQFLEGYNSSEYLGHKALRESILAQTVGATYRSTYRTGGTLAELKEWYGIIDFSAMPSGSYSSDNLDSVGTPAYGTTGEFDGVDGATNHCAATAVFNSVVYYKEYRNAPTLFKNNSRTDTFTGIHAEIGNGPVLFSDIISGMRTYVEGRGFNIDVYSGGSYSNVKTAISNNRMSIILLYGGISGGFHMENGIGYREYSTGTKYIRIVDGWETSTLRFILSGSVADSISVNITA